MFFVRLFDLLLFEFVFWCLGWAAACDCGTPWTFLLMFVLSITLSCPVLDAVFPMDIFLSYF